MKKLKSIICVTLSVFGIFNFLLLSACGTKYDAMSHICFNTEVYVVADGKISTQTRTRIISLLNNLDNEFSLTKENSLFSRFNSAIVNQSFEISLDAKNIIKKCKEVNQLTSKFNPAIFPLTELWQLSSSTYKGVNGNLSVPTDESISSLLSKINFQSLTINEENMQITKTEDIKADFGGAVKGYASDLIKNLLIENGHTKGYVSVGGSSLSFLTFDDGLLIRHPRSSDKNILKLVKEEIQNKSISTSGDYERYYIIDGKRYSHIIDTATGRPAQTGMASVTVVGDDGCFLDAISTALCCMTKDELITFSNDNLSELSVYAVYINENENKKEILTNKKQGEDFALLDSEFTICNFNA